jgi:hypothetical protein
MGLNASDSGPGAEWCELDDETYPGAGAPDLGLRAEIQALRSELAERRTEARLAREDLIRHVSIQFHLLRADLRTVAERISALSARVDHLVR